MVVLPLAPVVASVNRSSGLHVVENPNRVATFSCISQSPYAPLGPNSLVVGIHHIEAPVVNDRSSCVALTPRMLLLSPSIALYQSPGTSSPCAQTPAVKKGRKNSSAMTRSGASQNGCEPWSERVPGFPLRPV